MKTILDDLIASIDNPRQRALVLHAYDLFRRYGFQRVSVAEICLKAEVSKVTFYKFFANKDELILFLTRNLFDELLRKSRDLLGSNAPIQEKLAGLSGLKQNLFAEVGDEMMQAIMINPATAEYLQDMFQTSNRIFREYLVAEQQIGVVNPHVSVDLILLLIQEISRIYGENKMAGMFANSEEMIRQVNDLFWYGLLTREQR